MKTLFAIFILLFSIVGQAATKEAQLKPVLATPGTAALVSQTPTTDRKFEWKDRAFRVLQIKAKPGDDPAMDEQYGFGPVIEITKGKEKSLLDLGERFRNHVVTNVLQDEYNRRVWVILEWGVAGPGEQYEFIISDDGGDTWAIGEPLMRPSVHPRATLSHIWVNARGIGEAWLTQDASFTSSEKTQERDMKRGQELIFKATTSNGGRKWRVGTKPLFYNGLVEVPAN